MTRGPLPAVAIQKAMTVAAGRGIVIEPDLVRKFRRGFILICPGHTYFVQVRRTRFHLTGVEDCAAEYRPDIQYLRRIPQTGVVARELWLLSPWGIWQYFRILDDRVIEIRSNGIPILQEGAGDPVLVSAKEELMDTSPALPSAPSEGGIHDPDV